MHVRVKGMWCVACMVVVDGWYIDDFKLQTQLAPASLATRDIEEGFHEELEAMKSEHQRIIAQIRLECASDTARQVNI